MAEKKQGSWVALGVVALVAFAVGRGSVETADQSDVSTASYSDDAPQTFADLPTSDVEEVAEPEIVTVEPEWEAVPVAAPAATEYVYYRNCSAARAAGAAPVYSGDPGYASHLDRDNDGIGCE